LKAQSFLLKSTAAGGISVDLSRKGQPAAVSMSLVGGDRIMEQHKKKPANRQAQFDLDSLLHPAQAFTHPTDVVNDTDLTLAEKRAMLSSWASDARATEDRPALQHRPDAPPVAFDDVMDALRKLDRKSGPAVKPRPHYRRVLQERVPGVFGRTAGTDNPGRELG
jgi:hypothetical protein